MQIIEWAIIRIILSKLLVTEEKTSVEVDWFCYPVHVHELVGATDPSQNKDAFQKTVDTGHLNNRSTLYFADDDIL